MRARSKPVVLPPGCPQRSPWGTVQLGVEIRPITYADESAEIAMYRVHTASHGGIKVKGRLNRQIPVRFRQRNGWYEEDVLAAVPMFFLSSYFTPLQYTEARKTLRNWCWEAWERHFKEEIPLAESRCKAEDLFRKEHADDLLGISYWSNDKRVPAGTIGVAASRGASRRYGVEISYWLVPQEEFKQLDNPCRAVIIDPARHQPWQGPHD